MGVGPDHLSDRPEGVMARYHKSFSLKSFSKDTWETREQEGKGKKGEECRKK